MIQVKGSLMLDYVRLIRANRDRNWDRWLKPADWEIINGKVLPSQKFPYELFRRIGFAVFKEIAQSNLETVRGFGRFNIRGLIQVYQASILVPGDPMTSVRKLSQLRKLFMEGGGETRMEARGPKGLRYEVMLPEGETHDEGTQAYAYQIAGNLEELIERAGGKQARTSVEKTLVGYDILAQWE
jgi:hypothetical protein